jgi:transcriptional regulator with XRE-family HTH domain
MSTPDDSEAPVFRHYLKEWRIKRGLSQLQLADRMDTSKGLVSRWERGERSISLLVQFRLMRILDIQPAQFFMDPDDPSFDTFLLLQKAAPEERKRLNDALRMLVNPKE